MKGGESVEHTWNEYACGKSIMLTALLAILVVAQGVTMYVSLSSTHVGTHELVIGVIGLGIGATLIKLDKLMRTSDFQLYAMVIIVTSILDLI